MPDVFASLVGPLPEERMPEVLEQIAVGALIRDYARFRMSAEPELLRNSMRLAFLRRCWSLLSNALHVSIA